MSNQIVEIPFDGRMELPFPWVCSTLLIDDVDKDGVLEVSAASRCGKLRVFKSAPDGHLWIRDAACEGLVTVLVTGDLMNDDHRVIACFSELGQCLAFRLSSTHTSCALELLLAQTLQANISSAYIGDVDGDGRCELLVSLTDRVVRTYRYSPANAGGGHLIAISKWETPGFIDCISCSYPSMGNHKKGALVFISQPQGRYVLLKPRHGSGQRHKDNPPEANNHPSISYFACTMPGIMLCSSACFVHSFCPFDLKRIIFVEPMRLEIHLKLPQSPLAINTALLTLPRLSGDHEPCKAIRTFIVGTELGKVYFTNVAAGGGTLLQANLHTKVRCFASSVGSFSPLMTRIDQCLVAVCNGNNRLLLYSVRSDKLLRAFNANS